MYLGQIVELAPVEQIFNQPAHPYTKTLLSAIPVADPTVQRKIIRKTIIGESPDPANSPSGCSFHPRCEFVMDICRVKAPPTKTYENGSSVSCWL